MSLDRDAYFETFALSTRLYLRDGLDVALRRIAAAGFRWVELWADGCHLDPRQDLDVPAAARLMRDLGIRAHSVHTPFGGLYLGHPARCDRSAAYALIAGAMERAAELGARVAVVHPNSYEGPLEPELHDASRAAAHEIVARAAAAAERLGMRVAVENMVGVGYWRYGVTIAELARDLADRRVGFCLDVGHASVQGLDIPGQVRAAGDRLASLHVHDNDGRADRHLPPLRGVIDWAALDAALAAAGYAGRRVLEIAYREGEEDALLAEAAALWRRLPGPTVASGPLGS